MNFISLSMVAMSLFASANMGSIDVKATTQENPKYIMVATSVSDDLETKEIIINSTVGKIVTKYFKDIPIMAKVAECESEFRQFDKDGNVLRGKVNKFDVGVMQINEKYHLELSKQKNMNIYTLEGNLLYARALYNDSGTAPWVSSKPCWGPGL